MNFFSSLSEEKKTPVTVGDLAMVPLSKQDLRSASRLLPYALPALIHKVESTVKRTGTRHKGKGRRGETGENIRMMSPMQASKLNTIYNVVQALIPITLSSSNSVPLAGGQTVTLAVFDPNSSWATVFDQYRIALVEYHFVPRVNIISTGSNAGQFYTVVDLDDGTSPTGISYMQAYPGCQMTEGFKSHKHTFVPHVAVAAYSGVFTSFANEAAPWIDVASGGVLHYGVKYYWTTSVNVEHYDLNIRAHLQFRNAR